MWCLKRLYPIIFLILFSCSQLTDRSDYQLIQYKAPPKIAYSPGQIALMYLPNRILDLLEIVRFGYGVGPGFGFDIRITKYGQLAAEVGLDAGIGWEGRLHKPFRYGKSATAAIGPLRTSIGDGETWKKSDFEIYVEYHALLDVIHITIDFAEIYDFFAGLLTFDPLNDDY